MRTRNSLVCLTFISVVSCGYLVGCADDSSTKTQATIAQVTPKKPNTLTFDEIDLLAECQGHEEYSSVGVDPDDEVGRLLVDGYRQAATHVPIEQRQHYEETMMGVIANLAETRRNHDQSTDVAERRKYRSKLLGAEAEKLWARCDKLMVTRFPRIDAEMVAKARSLNIKP